MLDLQIQTLLTSNEVKQISFTMAGLRVSGHGYFELSTCFATETRWSRRTSSHPPR
jgi:hypothetical protein